ncbi:MAG: hypothetical protein AAF620_12430 [Bacteroidota bacterium]
MKKRLTNTLGLKILTVYLVFQPSFGTTDYRTLSASSNIYLCETVGVTRSGNVSLKLLAQGDKK